MDQLKIGNELIPYAERRNAHYRRITLSILDDHVRISAPKNTSAKQLKNLLIAKQEWILTQWLAARETFQALQKQYQDGEQFSYRGQTLALSIRRRVGQSARVNIEGQELAVYKADGSTDSQDRFEIQNSLKVWYKVQARQVLKHKLDEQAKRMQVSYQEFRLKDQKTRWGSCSYRGNINLNWRIIMAPEEVINYLVTHELAHLTHPNHSLKFWQRVEEFMPDYVCWRNWLKDHGCELVL